MIEAARGLCPTCWAQTPFIVDPPCEACGRPLVGDAEAGDLCNDCYATPRPWSRGRAALLYEGNGRSIVLKLKHGDRTDLARVAGDWLAQASRDLAQSNPIVAPVPLHWLRMLKRKYNQSALLADRVASVLGLEYCADLLIRSSATRSLDGLSREHRRETVSGAIRVNPKRTLAVEGRHVLLIDDVMTTGATLEECATLCKSAGAADVSIAILARVAGET
ncbi:ComF family protein [Celeribacter arenosi]|uniref:ComF family protein n=2 Tax=Celeribacter arenosi TaxID=792649 RepID=A0ABP7JXS0_9RHOB